LSKARRLRRALASSGFAWSLLAPPAAGQASGDSPIRFEYDAPAECPDAATFTGRVRERTARGRLAEPNELARTFNVSIVAAQSGFHGTVAFLDDAGAAVSRRIHGEQCDEVVSSLALITALALDASLRPEEETEPLAPPEPPKSEPKPLRPEIDVLRYRVPTRWASPTTRGPSARVGVAGGYRFPLDAWGLRLLGELDWGRRVGVRLAAHYEDADRELDDGRRANLRLLGVESSVCAPWTLLRTVVLSGCGMVDVGSLRARGLESPGLTSLRSATILWVAVGAEARLAWEPDAPFWLELNGQLGLPLRAHQFIFENPRATVLEVGPDEATGGLNVATGVRFW
jgi:hypothetical protein